MTSGCTQIRHGKNVPGRGKSSLRAVQAVVTAPGKTVLELEAYHLRLSQDNQGPAWPQDMAIHFAQQCVKGQLAARRTRRSPLHSAEHE